MAWHLTFNEIEVGSIPTRSTKHLAGNASAVYNAEWRGDLVPGLLYPVEAMKCYRR